MHCPECKGDLDEHRACGIDIDECGGCGGVWFDAGELDAYRTGLGLVQGDRSSAAPSFEPAGGPAWTCPRCSTASLEAGTVGHHGLRRCASCAGVYVSRAVLEQLGRSPARRHADGAAKTAQDAAGPADFLIEAALELVAGIFDGL